MGDIIVTPETIKMATDYQQTYNTPQGFKVFHDLLIKNYFFSELKAREEMTKRNVIIRMLQNMGAIQMGRTTRPITAAILKAAIDHPFKVSKPKEGR